MLLCRTARAMYNAGAERIGCLLFSRFYKLHRSFER
jgi:hypothetical protein